MKGINEKASNRRIILRTVLPVTITVLFFLCTAYFLYIPYHEKSLIQSKREMIKELTNNVWSLLLHYDERVRSNELSLQEAQERVINRIREMRYGPEGKDYFWINDVHSRMIMHPYRRDLEGKDISDITDSNGKNIFVETVKIVKEQGSGYADYMWQWKDDSTRIGPKTSYVRGFEPWGWIVGTGIYIEDVQNKIKQAEFYLNLTIGIILAIIVLLSCITIWEGIRSEKARLSFEMALKGSEQIKKNIIDFLPDATFVIDDRQRIISWNRAMEELTGVSATQVMGKGEYEYAVPFYGERCPVPSDYLIDPRNNILTKYTNIVKERNQISAEAFAPKLGEQGKYIYTKASLLYDSNGKMYGAIESIRNITKQKEAEQSLKRSEDRFRSVIEASKDAMIAIDIEGRITLFNPAAEAIFGWNKNDLLGQPLDVLISDEYRSKHQTYINGYVTTGKPDKAINNTAELSAVRRDGSVFPIDLSLSEGKFSEERFILAIIRDIGERKKTEKKIRDSEYNLQRTQQIAKVGSWQWYPKTNESIYSKEAQKIIGLPFEKETIHQTEFEKFIHPDDRDSFNQNWILLTENKDNKDIIFRINSNENVKWIHSIAEYEYDEMGKFQRIIGSIHDITEIKQIEQERKKLEDQLQQAQKMEAIGTLAGGIAHDFNNILFAIMGYLELIEHDLPPDSPIVKWIDPLKIATNRAADLVKQILAFSRKGKKERINLELNSLIKEIMSLLRSSIPSTIEIVSTIPDISICINADPTQIHQVIMNLCTNSTYAMKEKGGRLELVLKVEWIETKRMGRFDTIDPGCYAVMSISDTGIGISPDIMDRIFDPFFTTKPEGEGTGMGLSVVHGIITSHNGLIDITSELGRSTKVDIYFPLSEESVQMMPDSQPSVEPKQYQGTVLIVDDEQSIVIIDKRRLEQIGFDIVGVTDSLEALKIFRSDSNRFQLVITDFTMPKLTGLDMAREMLAIRADIPIVVCTGYIDTIIASQAKEIGIRELVQKPISREKLIDVIRKVL